MAKTFLKRWRSWQCLPVIAALVAAPGSVNAQQSQSMQRMQTGDGLLSVQTNFPSEVRVGEQFTYTVEVSNASDNATLHDIKLQPREGSGVSIESVKKQGQSGSSKQQDQKKQSDKKQSDKKQSDKKQSDKKQSDKKQKSQDQKTGSSSQSQAISIDSLKPGQSQSFTVAAAVDQEGPVDACLMISSYQPALCLQSKAVKPELEIVKTAPKESEQCDVIELTYAVKNGGSGTVERFKVNDQLAEGLRTIEGKKNLSFDVDGLESGEVRKFVARVFASKTGEFKSRAVAKATDSDLKSRSKNVGPKVVGVDLQASLKSSDRVYGGRPVVFTAMITNTGNAVAEDVEVDVRYPQQASLNNISDPQMKSKSNRQKSNQKKKGDDSEAKPTPVEESGSNSSDKQSDSQSQQDSKQKMKMASEQITLSRLAPGQTAEFEYTVTTRGLDKVESAVEALYVCAADINQASAQSKVRKTTQAMASTKVTRVPALQIFTIDDTDPVPSSESVTYTIRVRNEGDVADNNVQITANLPKQLKFKQADGPTKHQQAGDAIEFDPIKKLEAGDSVEYTLTGTPTNTGSVVFNVELRSDYLQKTVRSEEPTRLISK